MPKTFKDEIDDLLVDFHLTGRAKLAVATGIAITLAWSACLLGAVTLGLIALWQVAF